MAGMERPRCDVCGKWCLFDWKTDSFVKQCNCNKVENPIPKPFLR